MDEAKSPTSPLVHQVLDRTSLRERELVAQGASEFEIPQLTLACTQPSNGPLWNARLRLCAFLGTN